MKRSTCRELFFDPAVRAAESLFERDRRLPAEYRAQPGVVAGATLHTERTGHVAALDLLARYAGNNRHQFVNRDEPLLADVQWLPMLRPHQPSNALDAIVDVAVRPRLSPIAPHFDLTTIRGQRDFAADGRRRFFTPAIIRTKRSEDVVKAGDPGLEAEIFGVVSALALAEELFPAIAIFRIGGIGIFFFERRHIRRLLLVDRVNARG